MRGCEADKTEHRRDMNFKEVILRSCLRVATKIHSKWKVVRSVCSAIAILNGVTWGG